MWDASSRIVQVKRAKLPCFGRMYQTHTTCFLEDRTRYPLCFARRSIREWFLSYRALDFLFTYKHDKFPRGGACCINGANKYLVHNELFLNEERSEWFCDARWVEWRALLQMCCTKFRACCSQGCFDLRHYLLHLQCLHLEKMNNKPQMTNLAFVLLLWRFVQAIHTCHYRASCRHNTW